MPSGALAKKLLMVSGLGLVVLLLVGAAVGAIPQSVQELWGSLNRLFVDAQLEGYPQEMAHL